MEIIKYLDNCKVVKNYEVLSFKNFEDGFYIKIFVELFDKSILFISEYVDEAERNYSYHWQDSTDNIIIRWDNAPYHKDIVTFPHHLHNSEGVFESYQIKVYEILLYIEKQLVNYSI